MKIRFLKRLSQISGYAARHLSTTLGNAIIAYSVIDLESTTTWGAFVKVYIPVTIINHIINWGNRDHLLREFSHRPASKSPMFWRSLQSRSALMPLGFIFLYLMIPGSYFIYCAIWVFLQFLYQSLDVLIVSERIFWISTIAELIGILVILVGLYTGLTGIGGLLVLFPLSIFVKGVVVVPGLFGKISLTRPMRWTESLRFLYEARWFFLIGFSGLLQSRIDLYAVSFYLHDEAVGVYQVFISFVILLQSVSGFILIPFSSEVMRLPKSSLRRLTLSMVLVGMVIAVLGTGGVRWILQFWYGIDLDSIYYIFAILLTLPIYFYLPWVYHLYAQRREGFFMTINFTGAMVNLLLTLIFLPKYGMLAALGASAIIQWLLLILLPTFALRR